MVPMTPQHGTNVEHRGPDRPRQVISPRLRPTELRPRLFVPLCTSYRPCPEDVSNWNPYSSIRSISSRRGFGDSSSGDLTWPRLSRPPFASACSTTARDRSTAAFHSASSSSGESFCGRVPFPIGVGVPVDRLPRRPKRPAEETVEEHVGFDERQVLQQPAERDRRRWEPLSRGLRFQPATLPHERRALTLERAQQRRGLVAGERGFGVSHRP